MNEADLTETERSRPAWAAPGHTNAVGLYYATVSKALQLPGTRIINESDSALEATGVRVGGDVLLDRGFQAAGVNRYGAVRLYDAHIEGDVVLEEATIVNTAGPALMAERLHLSTDRRCSTASAR